MKFRRRLGVSGIAIWVFLGGANGASRIGEHFWPTPNDAFVKERGLSHFAQPTVSGRLESALWGCVRNGGSRFHEGIDLKALNKDRRGEATDGIYAFDDGVVRYVNLNPSKSSYGRYIVVEHPQWMPGMVTLYAHLSAVPDRIAAGVSVRGGETIATMGRSASYTIPRKRAHLHFEIGMWLGPQFQNWYDQQGFDTPNDHEAYNGMNIVGTNVWALLQSLRSGEARNVVEYFAMQQTAVLVTVWDDGIPDILRVNPELMTNNILPAGHAGWRIAFSASGLPLRFEAISASERSGPKRVTVEVVDERLAKADACVSMMQSRSSGSPSNRLSSLLNRLFTN